MPNIYNCDNINDLLKNNSYPGRGIIVGKSEDGKNAVVAYFIMGRSENSRNRVFVERDGDIYTEPFDFNKVEDPSLIIYSAVKSISNKLICTNGDQTDTIYKFLKMDKSSRDALHTRAFEPDAPNLTPRISAVLDFANADFTYEMSILKSADSVGSYCNRYFFEYHALCGVGHFIHTYICDGNPIPTFCGEPERVAITSDIDEFTNGIWESLNANNKISLYVRYQSLENGNIDTRIINKNK